MKETVRQTRSYLMKLFERQGIHPRTALGQNFLIDLNIVEFIAERANLGPHDVVLEVGAGTGGLTVFLAEYAAEVISIEIDDNMFGLAKEVTADAGNVTLLNRDVLENKNHFSEEVLEIIREKLAEDPKRRLKLVSNLPYNIATPVVSNLVATDLRWERMVVTIQWELAERMSAKSGDGQYGALSVWLQSQCFVKILKRLPPTVFWPRPGVFSGIVQLVPNVQGRKTIMDRPFFQDFIRRLFHLRRKFARSVLVGMYRKQLTKTEMDTILAGMNLDQNTRAEEMNTKTLVELANRIHAAIGVGKESEELRVEKRRDRQEADEPETTTGSKADNRLL